MPHPPRASRSTASSLASGQATDQDRDIELTGAGEAEKLAPMAASSGNGNGNDDGTGNGNGPPGPPKEFKFDLKFWSIMICNFLALFLVALDRTILATAVPRITDEFHSLGDVGWYASAYMLTTSASQLLFGRIYKFYSMKWTFLICIVVFEIGSAICGAAPNSAVFIAGRAIAGLASAGIFTGCMMIFMMVPLHKRPMFQGLFGMVFGIASVMGPLIGGGFTGTVSWRWCFYINLPIGAVSIVFMVFWWNPPRRQIPPAPVMTHFKRLDPLGTFFFLPAVVALLLALQWGGSTFAWNSGTTIALFVVFGVLIVAFAAVQITMPDTATIPPRVITQRSVLSGAFFTFFLAGSMLMCVYFLPIWFQTAQGVDPLRSGIYTLPLVLSLVASSLISGIFTQKLGYYVPSMLVAPIIMSIGEGLLGTLNPTSPSSHWIAFQFLTGFGLGFGMQTSGLAVQTVLPMEDVSTGVAIIFFTQQLGGAVFTSVGQAILSNLLVSQLTGVNGLSADTIVNAGITDLMHDVPPEDRGLIVNAYNFACTRIFLAAMGLAFGSLISAFFMEWRNIKKAKQQGGPGGGPAGAAAAGPSESQKGGDGSTRVPKGAVRLGSRESITIEAKPGGAAVAGAETPEVTKEDIKADTDTEGRTSVAAAAVGIPGNPSGVEHDDDETSQPPETPAAPAAAATRGEANDNNRNNEMVKVSVTAAEDDDEKEANEARPSRPWTPPPASPVAESFFSASDGTEELEAADREDPRQDRTAGVGVAEGQSEKMSG